MKIRRFRLRGAPRFPVVVEPPPADCTMEVAASDFMAGVFPIVVAVIFDAHRKEAACTAEF